MDQAPMSTHELMIEYGTFNKKYFKYLPVAHKNISGDTVETSQAVYYDKTAKSWTTEFYIELNDEATGIVFADYKYKHEATPDNLEAYKLLYNITSMQTIKSPTAKEQYTLNVLDAIYEKAIERLKWEVENDDSILSTSYRDTTEMNFNKKRLPLKRLYDHPMFPERERAAKGIYDESKPLQINKLRFVGKGKGRKYSCTAIINGPGDISASPAQIAGKQGEFQIALQPKDIYFGAHGKQSYVASTRNYVAMCNYVLGANRSGPSRNLLGSNRAKTAVDQSNDSSNFEEEDGDDGFTVPGSNPADDLMNAGNDGEAEEEETGDSRASAKETTKKRKLTPEQRKALLAKRKAKLQKE